MISLQSVEYFLKPVDYEVLTGGLSRALDRARLAREASLHRDLSNRWERSRGEVVEHFWRQVLGGLFHGDAAAVQARLREGLLPYTVQSRFVPALIRPLDRSGALCDASLADVERGLRERCELLMPSPESLPAALAMSEGEWALVLDAGCMPESVLALLLREVREWLGIELLLGLGGPCFLHEVFQQVQDLREMLLDNVRPQDAPAAPARLGETRHIRRCPARRGAQAGAGRG